MADDTAMVLEPDTAAEPVEQPLELPEEPVAEAPDQSIEDAPETEVETVPETESRSLDDLSDEEIASNERVKKWYEGELAKARESERRKAEHIAKQAQYEMRQSQAAQVRGQQGIQNLANVMGWVNQQLEEGKSIADMWPAIANHYADKMLPAFEANAVAVAHQASVATYGEVLKNIAPGIQPDADLLSDYTQGVYEGNPSKWMRAYHAMTLDVAKKAVEADVRKRVEKEFYEKQRAKGETETLKAGDAARQARTSPSSSQGDPAAMSTPSDILNSSSDLGAMRRAFKAKYGIDMP